MANKLVIFKKGEDKPAFTGADDKSATITGLAAGTAVAAGDYQGALTDGTNYIIPTKSMCRRSMFQQQKLHQHLPPKRPQLQLMTAPLPARR